MRIIKGQTVAGWEIIGDPDEDDRGNRIFACRCTRCGRIDIRLAFKLREGIRCWCLAAERAKAIKAAKEAAEPKAPRISKAKKAEPKPPKTREPKLKQANKPRAKQTPDERRAAQATRQCTRRATKATLKRELREKIWADSPRKSDS